MKDLIISKELISEVLDIKLEDIVSFKMFMNELFYYRELLPRADCQGNISKHRDSIQQSINIYEFVHLNLKQWANFKNVFNIIDWSGEPEEIIAKAEEIMNEIN